MKLVQATIAKVEQLLKILVSELLPFSKTLENSLIISWDYLLVAFMSLALMKPAGTVEYMPSSADFDRAVVIRQTVMEIYITTTLKQQPGPGYQIVRIYPVGQQTQVVLKRCVVSPTFVGYD